MINPVGGFSGNGHSIGKQKRTISLAEFRKYGFMPEFLGRLPVRICMKSLSPSELIDVLILPPDSILNEYRKLLAVNSITLTVDKGALFPIAESVETTNLGARSLRTIMEELLEDIMFRAPELFGQNIHITRKMVVEQLEKMDS